MIETAAGIGFLISLVAFLRSEVGGRMGKAELLTALDKQNCIQSYLEWLRRQDQETLIHQIESSKSEMLSEVSVLGERLEILSREIWSQAGDMEARLRDLNNRIQLPAFSTHCLPYRVRANIPLIGRDLELQWLLDGKGDALLSGQPGAGKSELLQVFAEKTSARFLLAEDATEAVAAILASCPPILIIDDAGMKTELLVRLRHLRTEHALDFRLIASCWPFDKREVEPALSVNGSATKELEALPRKAIAEIIREIAKSRSVTASDSFIRIVAEQARGMPGLAASLSLATIAAGGEALVSGDLLLKDLTPFLLRVVGSQSIQILGAFACGGKKGLSVEVVARHLGKEILSVVNDMQKIALAGVLEQTATDALCVQPDFLRSSLLKETFFPDQGIAVPWSLCETLINSAKEPALGYLELTLSRGRARAAISDLQLRNICLQIDDGQVWDALAWIDESNCRWVLERNPKASDDIIRAALHYCPAEIVPLLIEQKSRLLGEWSRSGWDDAFQRRELIFKEALSLLQRGGATAAHAAIALSFELEYHNTESDPADPSTFHFRQGLIPLPAAQRVFTLWDRLLPELKQLPQFPWSHVIGVVDAWANAGARSMMSPPQAYHNFLHVSTQRMIDGLKFLAGDNQAALRWLHLQVKTHSLAVDVPAADADFMVLFPEERFDDWKAAEEEQTRNARDLALRWIEYPFDDLVAQLAGWHQQAEDFGRVWPQMLPVFSEKLSEIRTLSSSELSLALDRLPSRALGPLLDQAIRSGLASPEQLQQALARQDLHGFLIDYTLSGKTPQLYGQLADELPKWESLIECMCLQQKVSLEMLENLLRHKDNHLRREVALYSLSKDSGVPHSLYELWRKVVVEALINVAEGDDDPPHELDRILAADASIAPDVLGGAVKSGNFLMGYRSGRLWAQLVAPLSKEERRELLHRIKRHTHSPLPRLLVDRDPELFAEMLAVPELKGLYSRILVGDPNAGNWAELAKIALSYGVTHRELSYAVNCDGYSWSGRLSNYYQEWVDRFITLRKNHDSDIQRIADEGIKWSSSARDEQLKIEKKEAIYGWN